MKNHRKNPQIPTKIGKSKKSIIIAKSKKSINNRKIKKIKGQKNKSTFVRLKKMIEKRYKKPIGIYWTQSLMNSIFGSYPYDKISIYRLPSILGVFISFFLIFVIIRNIENESIAFLTVFFLIFSFLTISEIHQAKTDGLLFLFIGICNLIIYKLINFRKLSFPNKIFFLDCDVFRYLN